MVGGTALRGRPQVTQERHVGRAGEGGGERMDGLRGRGSSVFGITGNYSTAALNHGVSYSTVCEVQHSMRRGL